jgi:polyhydroxyalkanoate synthase subunit PhaC
MTERNAAPSSVEEIFDKYVEGIKIISQGAQADTGQTPKEVIWTKNKAKLYH